MMWCCCLFFVKTFVRLLFFFFFWGWWGGLSVYLPIRCFFFELDRQKGIKKPCTLICSWKKRDTPQFQPIGNWEIDIKKKGYKSFDKVLTKFRVCPYFFFLPHTTHTEDGAPLYQRACQKADPNILKETPWGDNMLCSPYAWREEQQAHSMWKKVGHRCVYDEPRRTFRQVQSVCDGVCECRRHREIL